MSGLRDSLVKAASLALCLFAFQDQAGAAEPPAAPADETQDGSAIPDWFVAHMTALVGRWRTDNGAYRSAQETADAYGLDWRWGVGGTTLMGRLYGIEAGKPEVPFWDFRVYWHPGERQARIDQWGHGGTLLSGWIRPVAGNAMVVESEQTLFTVDGRTAQTRHRMVIEGDSQLTESFDRVDGRWSAHRSYKWQRSTLPEQKTP